MTQNTKKTYKWNGTTYGEGKWGNEFTETPTVGQFKRLFDERAKDTGEDKLVSHNLVPYVNVICIDEDDDTSYRIVAVELERLWGCGCESGINILIAKVEDDKE